MTIYLLDREPRAWQVPRGSLVIALLGLAGCGGGDGTDSPDRYVPPSAAVMNTNDANAGSLRQAILDANANPGVDVIDFAIPGSGPHRIRLASPLPAITEAVVLDATTQAETDCAAGQVMVALDGADLGIADNGLVVSAGGTVIRGLAIHSFGADGIVIGTDSIALEEPSLVQCTFIGTDATGTVVRANGGNGITVVDAAIELIGGNRAAERNLISGNSGYGIYLEGQADPEDVAVIAGNLIGTDIFGVADFGNGLDGIRLVDTTAVVGGFVTGAGNTLSGNTGAGLYLVDSLAEVKGNRVGTIASGGAPLPNDRGGLVFTMDSTGAVGDEQPNLIANNAIAGIWFDDSEAAVRNNRIIDNQVGVLFTGFEVNGQQLGENNCIVGNGAGVVVGGETLGFVRADGNWWGDPSGPGGAGPGIGDSIDEDVLVEEWLTLRPPGC